MASKKIVFPDRNPRKLGLLMPKEQVDATIKQWVEEDHANIVELCRQRGINPDGPAADYLLAPELARELYPEPKKPGARSKWTDLNKGALVVEVERIKGQRGIKWAAMQLAKREPWKSFVSRKRVSTTMPDPAEVLRQVYHEFRDARWAALSRGAFEWHRHAGTTEEWDRLVDDLVKNPHWD